MNSSASAGWREISFCNKSREMKTYVWYLGLEHQDHLWSNWAKVHHICPCTGTFHRELKRSPLAIFRLKLAKVDICSGLIPCRGLSHYDVACPFFYLVSSSSLWRVFPVENGTNHNDTGSKPIVLQPRCVVASKSCNLHTQTHARTHTRARMVIETGKGKNVTDTWEVCNDNSLATRTKPNCLRINHLQWLTENEAI